MHFAVFSSEVCPRCHSANPTLSARSYFYCRPPKGWRSPAGVVRSAQIPISFRSPAMLSAGGWQILSRAHSLALSRTIGAALIWTSSRNWQTLYCGRHIIHAPPAPLHDLGLCYFRPRRSLAIGPKVRSNFTSPRM
jgi:hypothetical protein